MLVLPTAADRTGCCAAILAVSALLAVMASAFAQQYQPPPYPPSDQPPAYPAPAQPPAYPGPGYGTPNAPPPPPQQEVIPPPPGAAMVWQPGYWSWSRHGWVWVAGRYAAAPYPRASWIPGHWSQRHGGWVWIPGHWR
jgi:WXXGXW repeat (2 copies)